MLFAMPCIFYLIKWVMNLRHFIVACSIDCLHVTLITVPWKFCSTQLQNFKMHMGIAISLIGVQSVICIALLVGCFICVGWTDLMTLYLPILWVSFGVLVEFPCFLYNMHYIQTYVHTNQTWIWTNVFMIIPHALQIICGVIGGFYFFAQREAWMYFMQAGLSVFIIMTRIFMMMIDTSYTGEDPDKLVCEHYFD